MARHGGHGDSERASAKPRPAADGHDTLQTGDPTPWFDADPTPVFVLGADGALLASNRSGRQFLEARAAVSLRGGRIGFADDAAQNCFTQALEKITSGAKTEFVVVLRCDDGYWRRLHVLHHGGLSSRTAFVTVRGEPKREVDITPIVEAFRLSFAEGKVLLHVARGLEPKRIAVRLGVSPHTVRAHLRSLYAKLRVRGMQELIREYTRLTA
jgi:DNA-binding CsgD family transcriptional regulator